MLRVPQCDSSTREPLTPRVLITGLGLVTPLGRCRESSWQALQRGESGIAWWTPQRNHELTALCPDGWDPPVGLQAGGDALRHLPHSSATSAGSHAIDPVETLVLNAAEQAWEDARLARASVSTARLGCCVGASKGSLVSVARDWQTHGGEPAPEALDSESAERPIGSILGMLGAPSQISDVIANRFALQGPLSCPVAACATGLYSVELGASWIRQGLADVVIAGSADCSIHPALLTSFHRLGVLARNFVDPAAACQPFSDKGTGFLVGEGAGVLILESEDSAHRRSVQPYCELRQGLLGCDPAGITQLNQSGELVAELIRRGLQVNGLTASDIDLVNLHGTATRPNDASERNAMRLVFEQCQRAPRFTAWKGQLGHLLGAAGSVELGLTALALRDQRVSQDIDLLTREAAAPSANTPFEDSRSLHRAVKVSTGFGGHHAVTFLERMRTDTNWREVSPVVPT